ncbi:MAG: GDP-mannose 4,6-dehydratase [Pirellulales bacterium]|nr:GDP-mannose 4,6-dehydratase [Pirellulales bacterium]
MANVLVTGGAGFIGSHLTEALLARGDRVTVIDDESTGNAANLASLVGRPGFHYVRGTVAQTSLVERSLDGIDVVYHLAAAVGVELIAQDAVRTIETNIGPTANLCDLLRARHAAGATIKLFLASTSEVYGKNPKPRWTEEDDLVLGATTRPRWAYGASKAIDEFLVLGLHRQIGLPVVVGRFFNVVGPRQTGRYGMVVPRMVDAALDGGPVIVHDDGRQTRCFAHVHDVVSHVLKLMAHPAAVGQIFNIGGDEPIEILALAQRIVAAVDPKVPIAFQTYAQAYGADFEDVRARVPDLTKLSQLLGTRPNRSMDEIIAEVAAWRRAERLRTG